MPETTDRRVVIAKRPFQLGRRLVERAMKGVLPEPITSHFVVVGPRRYPPKQVIAQLTGLDRADFTSHQARRVLMNLGFPVGRNPPRPTSQLRGGAAHTDKRAAQPSTDAGANTELADALRRHAGQWVATRGDDLLVAAPTPHAVVGWLAQHHERADSMFRVPEDELAASGLAPL